MARQLFALIIGIDKYESGDIWNLRSARKDARRFEQWLVRDLQVPCNQIRTLLDSQATKRNIEDTFMSHLVNNAAIEPGDALVVFFAGHGSSIRAPSGWFDQGRGDVPVLCPYDYDTKVSAGCVNAGISDRSLHAMLQDLAQVKGDNITLILDACFSLPPSSDVEPKERHCIRYTPTYKAKPEDLLAGLWRSAIPHMAEPFAYRGFTGTTSTSHVVLAACGTGCAAMESEKGGDFTRALMALKDSRPIHKLTYLDVPNELRPYMMDKHQYAACAGANADRILFDGVPFSTDTQLVCASYREGRMQIDVGAMHGVSVGTEFSLHLHNCKGSLNLSSATFVATEVFSTRCLAEPRTPEKQVIRAGWARITRWNNQTPFLVNVKPSFWSFCRRSRLVSNIPSRTTEVAQNHGVKLARAKSAKSSDLTVRLRYKGLLLERRDPLIAGSCARDVRVGTTGVRSELRTIEAAARFHMHVYRNNASRPLADLVSMELVRLDSSTWLPISSNLLMKGRAELVDDEKGAIYAVVLRNHSDVDLWPYLAYFDAGGYYNISMVYHPDPGASVAPLRRRSYMVIGSGTTESEALSFALVDGVDRGTGFLKLFLSTVPTTMTLIEQGPALTSIKHSTPLGGWSGGIKATAEDTAWDTLLASITVVRNRS
ncbi:caspase domain-containing protein [Trametes punicea]|nr:caspase domain-containing protein [Trametes punicea]